MDRAHILLSIGGHHGNTVPKHFVTAPEIAVLRAIHGEDSVKDVQPADNIRVSHRAERDRLMSIYGGARDETGRSHVETMFPGVAARLHETIAELDLDESFFKATGRMSAPAVEEAAVDTDEPAPAVEAVEPQNGADEGDDGVGDDINDEHAEQNVLG